VPQVVRLLADPVRWQLVQLLACGDQRVRELVAASGLPQNLVSYHVRRLRDGGLVTARRSSFDGRDTYYSLDLAACSQAMSEAAAAVHPGLAPRPGTGQAGDLRGTEDQQRVLFVCTGNSGRSPMAQALLAHRAGPRVQAFSAGIRPKPLHPDAVAVMRDQHGIDIAGHRPTAVDEVAGRRFDYVISLCDKAREAFPEFAGQPARMHWSMPDPGSGEGGLRGYPAFERTAAELDTRISFLLPVLAEAA
jgi:ArsR family transcriptional regulator, arsenate/arsenite/antimonite-responsive transcriptional repressor / arsenate reductase (thioredoxin)